MDRIRELVKEQNHYVCLAGGILEIKEADETYNDFNREIIRAYKKKYPDAVIGNINCGLDGADIFKEIPDGKLYNFCCDFVIPKEDEKLEEMIFNFRVVGRQIDMVDDRIKEIGGQRLLWF